ncbi:MAG: hypothetical protein U0271_23905 [Polyangiaceae bacterium]
MTEMKITDVRRLRWVPLSALLLVASMAGCDLDTAIFVDPTIESPEATIKNNVLGVSLTGSFDLVLHLGSRASDSSEVTYSSFTLETSDRTVLLDSLPITASAPSPVTVDPGEDVTIQMTIDTGDDVLDAALYDQACAGNVVIAGVIDDSLATSSTPFVSQPFALSGCP